VPNEGHHVVAVCQLRHAQCLFERGCALLKQMAAQATVREVV